MKTNNNRLLRVGENIRAILSKYIISNLFSKLIAKEIKTKYTPRLKFFPDLVHKRASLINKIINEKWM